MYMTYTVTITSQGQMSIPMPIRRQLRLDKVRQATVTVEHNKIIVEPVQDIDDLLGIFQSKKRVSPLAEKKAFEAALSSGEV